MSQTGRRVYNYLDYGLNMNWYFVFEIVRLSPGKMPGQLRLVHIQCSDADCNLSFLHSGLIREVTERGVVASAR